MKKNNLIYLMFIFGLIILSSGFVNAGFDPGPICGDGILDEGEECDGTDFGNESCQSRGYDLGFLICDCGSIDDSECWNEDEDEDDCGNGVIDDGEDCDDGNDVDDDDCPSDCTIEIRVRVYLDPKYIDDTEKYRDFTPNKITPFDDIICEVSKSKAGSSGKLLTVDDSGEWNMLIASGTFDSEGKWRINGWNYDGSAGGLGSGPAWTSNDVVIGQIFKTEKVRCEVVGESDLVADSSDEGWAHKYTACPFYADLGGCSLGEFQCNVRNVIQICSSNVNLPCDDSKIEEVIQFYSLNPDKKSPIVAMEDTFYDWLEYYKEDIISAANEFTAGTGVDPNVLAKLTASIALTELWNERANTVSQTLPVYVPSIWSIDGIKMRLKGYARVSAKIIESTVPVDLPESLTRNPSNKFGNMHPSGFFDTISIIRDEFNPPIIENNEEYEKFNQHLSTVSCFENIHIDQYNNNLKNSSAFRKLAQEDWYELFNKDRTRDKETNVRMVAAMIAAFREIWLANPAGNNIDLYQRPEIIGTLYNMGWAKESNSRPIRFNPNANPQPSPENPFGIIVDGKTMVGSFAGRVKLLYESERMKKFFENNDMNICGGNL